MGKLVTPEVYWIGYTRINGPELERYLKDSGNEEFLDDVYRAREEGLSDGEILCSFMAKLCYASLTVGHNDNITQVRDIAGNIKGCFDQGHGSVFEHAGLNFVVRNCSRVFETELVRHRVGTAFSILSGRYERVAHCDIVYDPVLEPVRGHIERLQAVIEGTYADAVEVLGLNKLKDRDKKKKLTSALRRILPQGKAREVGFTANFRALRHTVQMRTSRHSEWEIREVFGQVYRLVMGLHPLLFYGAKEEVVDGLLEVSGMKMQPYERSES